MLNLDQRYINMILDILATHAPYDTVWAYGSRIKDKAHSGSDLDLILMSTDKDASQKIIRLREAFSESNLPILIDILDWNTIPESFKEEINKQHEILQEGSRLG